MDDLEIDIEKPMRPQTEVELLASVRDSLILCEDSGFRIRISGHEQTLYSDWYDALEALEELLELRPFTFDV